MAVVESAKDGNEGMYAEDDNGRGEEVIPSGCTDSVSNAAFIP